MNRSIQKGKKLIIFKQITLIPKKINGKGTIGAQLQPNMRKESKKNKKHLRTF